MNLYTADPEAIKRIADKAAKIQDNKESGIKVPTEKEIRKRKIEIQGPEVEKILKDRSVLKRKDYSFIQESMGWKTKVEREDFDKLSFHDRVNNICEFLLGLGYITVEENNYNRACWEVTSITGNANSTKVSLTGSQKTIRSYIWEKIYNIRLKPFLKVTCDNPKCCNPFHMKEVTSPMETTGSITVNNVKYDSAYTVNKKLKIPLNLVKRFTRQGVFDVEKYRQFCIKTNREYVI